MWNLNEWMFSSNTDQRATPQDYFDKVNEEFWFNVDVCADESNHKCETYFTKEQDWLAQNRNNLKCRCNPPYWREIGKRVEKAYLARGGVLLCFYQQGLIQDGFMIGSMGKLRLDLSNED